MHPKTGRTTLQDAIADATAAAAPAEAEANREREDSVAESEDDADMGSVEDIVYTQAVSRTPSPPSDSLYSSVSPSSDYDRSLPGRYHAPIRSTYGVSPSSSSDEPESLTYASSRTSSEFFTPASICEPRMTTLCRPNLGMGCPHRRCLPCMPCLDAALLEAPTPDQSSPDRRYILVPAKWD
jgi:hypothetical protein